MRRRITTDLARIGNAFYNPASFGKVKEMAMEAQSKPVNKPGQHRASYARDNKKGGYLIRVEGPMCEKFAGRDVPVSLRDGGEPQTEKLDRLIWCGTDKERPTVKIALYSFITKPRTDVEEIQF
jgi:hypothetical protein